MSGTSFRVLSTLTATIVAMSAGMASSKQVTLTEVGGQGISISGELLSYDGDRYMLRTSLGDLSLEVIGSICAGDACPAFVDGADALSVADAADSDGSTKIVSTN